MIDAYEIGIQLLLQDDVSAGLAVINRELAEVDRAIAATSADLVGLVREAETGTKAVAAAVTGRAPPAAATDQRPGGVTEQAAQEQPARVVVTPPVTSGGEKAAAPEMKAAEPPVPAAGVTSSPSRDEQPVPQAETRVQTILSSAPVKSGVTGNVMSDERADKTQAQPEPPSSIAPAQAALTAPEPRKFEPPSARHVTTARQEPRGSVTPPSTQVALAASVSRVQRLETPGTQPEPIRHTSTAGPGQRRERPVAPWSGVDHQFGAQAETTRSHERAAAPQSGSQTQTGLGGGTVMLDGRLVGQWLSEHMARDASRPPAGTSFFDPRQTPAWNVSGAL